MRLRPGDAVSQWLARTIAGDFLATPHRLSVDKDSINPGRD